MDKLERQALRRVIRSICERGSPAPAMQILGPQILGIPVEDLRRVLEPDFTLAGVLSMDDILAPARSYQWPVNRLDEYQWLLGEMIHGVGSGAESPSDHAYAAYLALVLLHCEVQLGELAIPRSRICSAIICRAASELGDVDLSVALLCSMLSFLDVVLDPVVAHFEGTLAIEAGMAFLLRTIAAQLLRAHEKIDPTDFDAPWLVMPGAPDYSIDLWRKVIESDVLLTDALREMAKRKGL